MFFGYPFVTDWTRSQTLYALVTKSLLDHRAGAGGLLATTKFFVLALLLIFIVPDGTSLRILYTEERVVLNARGIYLADFLIYLIIEMGIIISVIIINIAISGEDDFIYYIRRWGNNWLKYKGLVK